MIITASQTGSDEFLIFLKHLAHPTELRFQLIDIPGFIFPQQSVIQRHLPGNKLDEKSVPMQALNLCLDTHNMYVKYGNTI